MLVHVEVALEQRVRDAPCGAAGVGLARADVAGDGATREEPDLDELRRPLGRVDASVGGIEPRPKREVGDVGDLTPGVGRLVRRIDVAIWGHQFAREISIGHVGDGYSCVGMEGHFVGGSIGVHSFDDIDFPASRPGFVGTEHPECRPGSADPPRLVGDVRDHEGMLKSLLRCDSYARPTLRGNISTVNSKVNGICGISAIYHTGQTSIVGCFHIDELDISIGRVRIDEEIKSLEEFGACVVLYKSVGGMGM